MVVIRYNYTNSMYRGSTYWDTYTYMHMETNTVCTCMHGASHLNIILHVRLTDYQFHL